MNKHSIEVELINKDLCLADNLYPHGSLKAETLCIFVTGATGFLGRYLVKTLLLDPNVQVLCLVRAQTQAQAEQKLLASLRLSDASLMELPLAVRVICGQLTATDFGLSKEDYHELAQDVDTVYHCAGEVNWVRTYRHLRETNVIGTLEVARFACAVQVKRLVFFSSLAVCFIPDLTDVVDEQTDFLAHIHRMAMGYAKSKCVAESLLAKLASRGLPVNVIRVGLIAGDSVHGASNPTDLLAAMIQGAVASASAIDADWLIDVLPVDFVVNATLALPTPRLGSLQIWHLNHPHPRHWREIILWLNLYGYPIEPVETQDWLNKSFGSDADLSNPIFSFKRFFCDVIAVDQAGQKLRPFETYLAQAQGRIHSNRTLQQLAPLVAPPLDSGLLHLYLHHYQISEKLPTRGIDASLHSESMLQAAQHKHEVALRSQLGAMLRRHLNDNHVELIEVRALAFQSHNGILNEIAAAKWGCEVGVRLVELRFRRMQFEEMQTLRCLIKTKTSDVQMQSLLAQGAQICDPRLGEYFLDHADCLGLRQSHMRELALYQWSEPRLRAMTPYCLGVLADPKNGFWSLVLEYVDEVDLSDISRSLERWQSATITSCIDGLAKIHAIAYQQTASLPNSLHLTKQKTCAEMRALVPMLRTLAEFSDRYFQQWLGHSLRPIQEALIRDIESWWSQLLAMPSGLVHNDFNPRNFVVRETSSAPQLCVFDWELAGIDVPQHDLAELLCFTLPLDTTAEQLLHYLEYHRRCLAKESNCAIDRELWIDGFVLALQHLMVLRLPSYCLFHRFKKQEFLEVVMRNWNFMYQTLKHINCEPPLELLALD
jgi:thioester reductase-like protein